MNSKKSLLPLIALAALGAFIFSLFTIHSSVSFVLGVALSAIILLRLNNAEQGVPTPSSSEDSSQATKTLYVGNLPYKANESHVRDLFAKYGEVFAVRLMKDKRTGKRRGFGFVVISAPHAQTAIDALNETDYMQRTLKVRIANDPKHPEEEMDE
ncbi:RNA-binding protein [Vibrio cincinnatiensis]|jgi:RNA recognition motif-containing protein|uniref:RNA recognition motif. (A.k.a. RRM, RBD, or RNP domain) n=1 Tax=Vibrio cincinnatiensis DSM 19608 TaxID=1123491 RepID=A0A1T4R2G4_VIBCI|nr:RNA-binding protein [Vibrio cincinnatiensis]MCG3722277.1 RNA-binding protein [Vibrio cincinnatiensis]MCG3727424.1 RNA-binding protein [Vibrio cincinnatiensis]MCG3734297.1 RNA-binding protein [Vibrio cincinnatiensis]MCG3737556.1 RNA-binding protein [Vibrio cincinnatiensis]MCG3740261.1 RNA-binding protein [Vibrio cincinnatiensis]